MKKLTLLALVIAACGGKKDPGTGSATGSSTASGSAPAGSGAAPAGSGSAPAGSGSAPAGSGSDMAAGSGSGSGSPNVVDRTGSGSGAGSDMINDPGIKFDKLPDGWESGAGKLDTFVAVNESKFPVDNATFVFEYGLDAKDMPADPKEYGAVLEKSGVMEKITKSEKTANGWYYESSDHFRYVIGTGDKRIHCGGSLYKSEDYDKIPKERDKAIAEAKKICQTAKL